MKIDQRMKGIALATGVSIVLFGGSAFGDRHSLGGAAISNSSDILQIDRAANGRLLAIGRLDSISATESSASVLGQHFILTASSANTTFLEQVQQGQAVAFFGDFDGSTYLVDAAIILDGQYVQGASKVYLRGAVRAIDQRIGSLAIGSLALDATPVISAGVGKIGAGFSVAIVGTQPMIAGKVLVESFALVRAPSRIDASVGTGSPNASVGTGSPDASVGTGSPNASVGTGSPNASVGTGSPDASVGTGSAAS